MNDIEKRFRAVEEVDSDAADLGAIKRIGEAGDTDEGISLGQMDALRAESEYSGKISLRVPKTLHQDLANGAKNEGISLNQFILYKLAK
jgi:predicted HicB family RNase H-like nuclease